jgi:uncharacterized membrane protein YkoI
MSQRTMLITTAALTAFVLIIVGSVISQVGQGRIEPTPVSGATQPVPTLTIDLQQREAAYQTALAEANQRIEQANQQALTAAQTNLPAAVPLITEGSAVAPVQGTSTLTLSAEQAITVALAYRGTGSVQGVELKEERGLNVYEVTFTDGGEIYVDATSGQVVYAQLSNGDGGDDDDEHDDD